MSYVTWHPIILEYIKTYDIVLNFKGLIEKSLPDSYKIKEIKTIEFNKEQSVLPQIVQMTTIVDNALNEIKLVFDQITDELVASKYDLLEKEHQILKLQQNPTSSLNISFQATLDNSQNLHKLKHEENEQLNEAFLKHNEIEFKTEESKISKSESVKSYDVQEKMSSFHKREESLIDYKKFNDSYLSNPMTIPTAEMYSPTVTYNSVSIPDENESKQLKIKYEALEKKYQEDINKFNKQIK